MLGHIAHSLPSVRIEFSAVSQNIRFRLVKIFERSIEKIPHRLGVRFAFKKFRSQNDKRQTSFVSRKIFKEQGIKLGRPPGPGKSKLDKFRPEIEALMLNGSTQKFIAGRYGTTEANLHNWLKKNSLRRNKL